MEVLRSCLKLKQIKSAEDNNRVAPYFLADSKAAESFAGGKECFGIFWNTYLQIVGNP